MKTLSKADGHKYQSREMGAGGHWKYTYADGAGGKQGSYGSSGAGKRAAEMHAQAKTSSGKSVGNAHTAVDRAGRLEPAVAQKTGDKESMSAHKDNARMVAQAHPDFTAKDHADAAAHHSSMAENLGNMAKDKRGSTSDKLSEAAGSHRAAAFAHAAAAKQAKKSFHNSYTKHPMKKSMTDPLGDITVESVYTPMGFARISDVDGTEIKTDAGSIDELAALVADMASYNAGTVVGGVLPAQRDKSTVPPAEEPPVAPQTTTIDVSGNAPADVPETEVVTKSCAALHSTLAAQWADAQSIVMGMPTFLPPDAPEGDARFALIGQ